MSLQTLLEDVVDRAADPLEAQFGLPLELKVVDPEVIHALSMHVEGAARDEFALRALRIGVLALQQAQGQIDATAVRQEGERLLQNVEQALSQHQQLLNERLTSQLKIYFDPQDGRFHERIERLIRQDGELEQLLRRHVGDDDSRLCQTLTQHIGDGSPLMRVLDPDAGDGIAAALQQVVQEQLHEQRQRVLDQFSLDNKEGALCRFLKEVQQHYDGISGDLTGKIDKAVGEFSLDDENSALSRLVGRVTDAQQTITREFSLDAKESALSRLRGELIDLLRGQSESNTKFQEEVKVAIGEMKARKEEAARSTRHGIEFEECLYAVVQAEAQRCGDIAEFTKEKAGQISRCKIGDIVVSLGADCAAPDAKIVFEAKEDQSYHDRHALDELDTGRKNREAQVGVFVYSSKTAPAGIDPFRRLGNSILIVWNSEDAASDLYVKVAFTLAKALCVSERRKHAAEAADVAEMERGVHAIESRIKDLDQIQKSATTVRNSAETILESERRFRKTIDEQIENLRERIGALKSLIGGDAASSAG
ncbi:MAG: hypothetical protein JNG89_20805 [Planctomycetaceae bacterium]|nr:hypothetical protein [Planctomycetaceae bacterium]